MAKLMYRCPRTGVNVDIWLADEVTPVSADNRTACADTVDAALAVVAESILQNC
jgi:hypothetical protein